ncbi:carbamoyltransferase N-terminal domain-containing protein [Engelhardtia mirabilis]|uniref:Decarbamoylnovobiocin carbamoyltransferase n=1 Tax=Engelhardtia mirabilis TaxID=2528011 RepID=A0A518BKH6_9BACT|nr:Decarbamoylnovobiocin carbamoyltransferase [Planctomycetes bacterium Pla133]QDV01804.1 Decarbamoylnovobiocin carbamoyltransferase [Planctomycetes bacterium Pla86]
MRILGISAFHRDSAAALIVDGQVVAAAQEEHFTRLARDSAFPTRAIRFVLGEAGVEAPELDQVVFYEKPLKKFERVLVSNLRAFPRSSTSFAKGLFVWLGDRIWIKDRIASDLGVPADKILFAEHLPAIGACAMGTSPFEEAAVLVVDDAGEWSTTLLARADAQGLESLVEVRYPHSLGLLASAVTQFLGFAPGEDEEKVEALSAHGSPRFADAIRAWIRDEGCLFALDEGAFRFNFESSRLWGDGFEAAFGPPRFAGEPLRYQDSDRRDADLAASLQVVLEERTLALAAELYRRAPSRNLCFAGSLAKNRRLLGRLMAEGPFERVHVSVVPGKAGGAVGAALLAEEAGVLSRRVCESGFVGESLLGQAEPGAQWLEGDPDGVAEVSRRLVDGERVAWMQGAIELGGLSGQGRVVLADARPPEACGALLRAVQHVEPFLPCRLIVPREEAERFVELPEGSDAALARGQLRVAAKQSLVDAAPSSVMADGTTWVQVVDEHSAPRLHAVVRAFGAATGTPLLLCTDFKLRGAPIVRSESEGLDAYMRSTLDSLIAGPRLYRREAIPKK